MIKFSEIETLIRAAIPDAKVEVSDMTGTGDHFEIHVVSQKFKDKSLMDQHKMVFATLQNEMDDRIHAVKLKTKVG